MRKWFRSFRRKCWKWVLGIAEKRLERADIIEVLDTYWWDLVRFRMGQIGNSDLGLNTLEVLFTDDEGNAVDSSDRDMRDTWRDVRSDRPTP